VLLGRVEQIIDERSGKMMWFKNPCVVLEDVICTSAYHPLCPRGIYPSQREIWVERLAGRRSAGDHVLQRAPRWPR